MNHIINQLSQVRLDQKPTVHQIEDVPRCDECAKMEKFFDFDCGKCKAIVFDAETSVAQLMAIARQWSPLVQSRMHILVLEMLRRGAHADDRDALTDMTLLQFVCKSGAAGMGTAEMAMRSAKLLVEKAGANPNLTCRWNHMTALHIATYYDVAPLVGYLVTKVEPHIINQPCAPLDHKAPLHIAATNLCLKSAKVLLGASANVLLKDQLDRTPLDCVPDDRQLNSMFTWNLNRYREIAKEMRSILGETSIITHEDESATQVEALKTAKVVLSALGFEIGDRVIVGNAKVGYLRYCGPTRFASGIWTGIELDEPIGKNDGSIDRIQYFVCAPNHGIFAPLNKISKIDFDEFDFDDFDYYHSNVSPNRCLQVNGRWSHSYSSSGIDMSTINSKIDTGLNRKSHRFSETSDVLSASSSSVNSEDIHLGSRVFLVDRKSGIVRFIGMTDFAPGIWYGIELSRPHGKNDGSVQNVRYFQCPDQRGIFVQFPRIARLLPVSSKTSSSITSPNAFESDDTCSDMSLTVSGTSSLDININHQKNRPSIISSSYIAKKTNGTRLVSQSSTNLKEVPSNFRRTMSLRRNETVRRSLNPSNAREQSWLRVGVNVLVNGMMASLRYIGPVHFAEGIYLGVELRTPNGKNDGSVDGKRYFTCKSNYGLLVPPQKITVRGINASKLMSDETAKTGIIKSKEI